MHERIVEIAATDWNPRAEGPWPAALEAGKVLYFPRLAFALDADERRFLAPGVLDPKRRNISLDQSGRLKGALGAPAQQQALARMIGRFRAQARILVDALFPRYAEGGALRPAPTSYRPEEVESRAQSWRADDRRLHVDAFPSRPNYGERILRVFTNLNPEGRPRVWRIGEPFEAAAERFLARLKPYSRWQARLLKVLHVTKSLRSEYDHLMLQLHDAMKSDLEYQRTSPQITMPFPAGSSWVCFSDQTSHAAMSGRYMMEQTFHLPVARQYDPGTSPLAVLSRLTGRTLV